MAACSRSFWLNLIRLLTESLIAISLIVSCVVIIIFSLCIVAVFYIHSLIMWEFGCKIMCIWKDMRFLPFGLSKANTL